MLAVIYRFVKVAFLPDGNRWDRRLKGDLYCPIHGFCGNVIAISGDERVRRLFCGQLEYNVRRVVLTLGIEGTNLKFSVQDFGMGVPEVYRNKIFKRFGQVSAKNSGQAGSTGLGLTFCKFAIKAHQGEIGLTSEEGKGSTF